MGKLSPLNGAIGGCKGISNGAIRGLNGAHMGLILVPLHLPCHVDDFDTCLVSVWPLVLP